MPPSQLLRYFCLSLSGPLTLVPSPEVKTFCSFEPQIWLEMITSRDYDLMISGVFLVIFWPTKFTSRDGHVLLNLSRQPLFCQPFRS